MTDQTFQWLFISQSVLCFGVFPIIGIYLLVRQSNHRSVIKDILINQKAMFAAINQLSNDVGGCNVLTIKEPRD